MRFWDLISLITENLGRRKGRVSMTAIGVVIGTAAVVLLVSLASGSAAKRDQQSLRDWRFKPYRSLSELW